jgi:hypothetical protein
VTEIDVAICVTVSEIFRAASTGQSVSQVSNGDLRFGDSVGLYGILMSL